MKGPPDGSRGDCHVVHRQRVHQLEAQHDTGEQDETEPHRDQQLDEGRPPLRHLTERRLHSHGRHTWVAMDTV